MARIHNPLTVDVFCHAAGEVIPAGGDLEVAASMSRRVALHVFHVFDDDGNRVGATETETETETETAVADQAPEPEAEPIPEPEPSPDPEPIPEPEAAAPAEAPAMVKK